MEEEARVEISLENRFKEALRKAKEVKKYIQERNDSRELDTAEWLAYDMQYVEEYVNQLLKENENLKQAIEINKNLYQEVCNKNKELEERVKVFDKAVKCDKCDCNICEAEKLLLDSVPKPLYEELCNKNKELEEENRELKIFKEMTTYRLDVIEPREFILKSKVEEQIKWLDNDIKNTKNKLEEGKTYPNYIGEHRRLRMKAFITKSKEFRNRLQELLRRRGEIR